MVVFKTGRFAVFILATSVGLGLDLHGLGQEQNTAPNRKSTPEQILESVSDQVRGLSPQRTKLHERQIHQFAVDLEKHARIAREQQEMGNVKSALDHLRQVEFLMDGLRGSLTMGRWKEYQAAEQKGWPANAPPPPPVPAPMSPRVPLPMGIGVAPLGTLAFLQSPAIQRELRLAPEVVTRAKEIKQKWREDLQAIQQDYAKRRRALLLTGIATPEQLFDQEDEQEQILTGLQAGVEPAMRALLTPDQRTRLEQIEIQAIGPGVFIAPEFKDARTRLKLNASEALPIDTLATRCRDELQRVSTPRAAPLLNRDRQETYAEAARVREAMMTAIERTMTAEQREAYKAMRGEPFDFSSMRPKP